MWSIVCQTNGIVDACVKRKFAVKSTWHQLTFKRLLTGCSRLGLSCGITALSQRVQRAAKKPADIPKLNMTLRLQDDCRHSHAVTDVRPRRADVAFDSVMSDAACAVRNGPSDSLPVTESLPHSAFGRTRPTLRTPGATPRFHRLIRRTTEGLISCSCNGQT